MLDPLIKLPNQCLGALNLDQSLAPTLSKTVSVNRPKLGPKGLGVGAAAPMVRAHPCWARGLCLAGLWYCLDLDHGCLAQSEDGLHRFWPYSSHLLALVLHSSEPSPLWRA
jgi:hypothetical protein